MPKVKTETLKSDGKNGLIGHGVTETNQIYNGFDCMLTLEILQNLKLELATHNRQGPRLAYDFERAMQGPALAMMLRGFRVDEFERRKGQELLHGQLERLKHILNRYAAAVWGKPLSATSPKQLQSFFYSAMGLPPVVLSFKGVRRVTVNREALEKLLDYYPAVPIIECILAIRDITKRLSVITSEVDDDKRMRTSYNPSSTETGRWSSSKNVRGGGTNLQNITAELRRMFVSDSGKKLGYLDLAQAESWVTGLIVWATTGDEAYLNAVRSGDLHTYVARLLWTFITDRKSAEKKFYRHFSYRDMSKRGGHASNYRVTPPTMVRTLKIEFKVATEFQGKYYHTFPGLPRWHTWTAGEIGRHRLLTTPFGRERHFFGRANDDSTIREAIAYIPQSTVADCLNIILYRLWQAGFDLLAQIHDAVVFQYDEALEQETMERALAMTPVPITMEGVHESVLGQSRTIIIPADGKTGWNWAEDVIHTSHGDLSNPDGLKKWKGKDERRRSEGLDRIVS